MVIIEKFGNPIGRDVVRSSRLALKSFFSEIRVRTQDISLSDFPPRKQDPD